MRENLLALVLVLIGGRTVMDAAAASNNSCIEESDPQMNWGFVGAFTPGLWLYSNETWLGLSVAFQEANRYSKLQFNLVVANSQYTAAGAANATASIAHQVFGFVLFLGSDRLLLFSSRTHFPQKKIIRPSLFPFPIEPTQLNFFP